VLDVFAEKADVRGTQHVGEQDHVELRPSSGTGHPAKSPGFRFNHSPRIRSAPIGARSLSIPQPSPGCGRADPLRPSATDVEEVAGGPDREQRTVRFFEEGGELGMAVRWPVT